MVAPGSSLTYQFGPAATSHPSVVGTTSPSTVPIRPAYGWNVGSAAVAR